MNKNNLNTYAVVRHYSIIQYYELTAITSLPTQIVSSASGIILVHFMRRKQHSEFPKIRKRTIL